ncbi:hypothetical protein NA56DRAFT_281167 [Hyaloscypha hepaticicola]|uniref:Uncharacterized protein n=1 Tax=Hyaloscypha hepaticicola TaxID=2082293 RepID=A0A2J6PT23_9HELO|nr:hypothetical protein NA56DRAFT_281167 [Hyaloscypha hepaticicola]
MQTFPHNCKIVCRELFSINTPFYFSKLLRFSEDHHNSLRALGESIQEKGEESHKTSAKTRQNRRRAIRSSRITPRRSSQFSFWESSPNDNSPKSNSKPSMSSEVVKKRGRPKKVISDPVEVEMPEATKKTTTRAKSTKAAPKTPVAKVSTSAKPSPALKPVAKSIASTPTVSKVANKPSGSSPAGPPKTPRATAKPIVKTPVSPESSKILSQLREQHPKTAPSAADPTKATKPIPNPPTSTPSPAYTAHPKAAPAPNTASSSPAKPPPKPVPTPFKPANITAKPIPPPPSTKPAPKPHVPIAALNSEIVSNITTRAGARPNPTSGNPLPKNYKSVANKVTMAIVAMPIAIVTSWVLYERLVLGEERKNLVKPGMAMVEPPAAAEGKGEGTPSTST